jgi:flagellar basal-body rod protein FlgB
MKNAGIATDGASERLRRVLDVTAARQRVAARNLSNVTTDGYEPRKIEFSDELARVSGKVEIQKTHESHLTSSREAAAERGYAEVVDEEALENPDTGLERTVAELTDAELAYATAAKLMAKRTQTLRTAITGQF